MIEEKENEAKMASKKKTGFDQFMREPLARAMISTLPPSENLELILRAAFDHGFNSGSVFAAIDLMTAIMTPPRPPR